MDQSPQSPHHLPQQPGKTTLMLLKWLGTTWAMGSLIVPQLLTPAFAQTLPESVPVDPEPMMEPVAPLPVEPMVEPVAPPPAAAPVELPPSDFIEPVAPAPIVQDPAPVETYVDADPAPYTDTYPDTYIDPQDYGLGATTPQPSLQPSETIGAGYSSSCQGIAQIRPDLAGSLCAPPPSTPRYGRYESGPPKIYGQERTRIYRQAELMPSVEAVPRASTYAYAPVAPRGLQAFDHGNRSYRLPYKITPLKTNPLKWLQPAGQRMLFPLSIPSAITSAFGWRLHPLSGTKRFHSGTDLGAPMGTPVLAAYAGKVAIADWLGGYGLSVLLEHDKGNSATRYAHLSEVLVQPGQIVKQGTVIGLVGSTGNSTGPHLHFETLRATQDGLVAVDPEISLKLGLAHLINALKTARLTSTKS